MRKLDDKNLYIKIRKDGSGSGHIKTTKKYAILTCSKSGIIIKLSDEPAKKGFTRTIESCYFYIPKTVCDTYKLGEFDVDRLNICPDNEGQYSINVSHKVTRLPKTRIIPADKDIKEFIPEDVQEYKATIIGSNDKIDIRTADFLQTVRIYNENRVIVIAPSVADDVKLPNAKEFVEEVSVTACPIPTVMFTTKSNIKLPRYFKELCNSPSYIVRKFSNDVIMVHPYNIKDEILDKEIDVINEKTETIKVSDEALAIKDNIAALISFFDNMSTSINSNTKVFETVYKETMEKFGSLSTVISVATNQAKLAFQEVNKAIERNSILEAEISKKEQEIDILHKELRNLKNETSKRNLYDIMKDINIEPDNTLELD